MLYNEQYEFEGYEEPPVRRRPVKRRWNGRKRPVPGRRKLVEDMNRSMERETRYAVAQYVAAMRLNSPECDTLRQQAHDAVAMYIFGAYGYQLGMRERAECDYELSEFAREETARYPVSRPEKRYKLQSLNEQLAAIVSRYVATQTCQESERNRLYRAACAVEKQINSIVKNRHRVCAFTMIAKATRKTA